MRAPDRCKWNKWCLEVVDRLMSVEGNWREACQESIKMWSKKTWRIFFLIIGVISFVARCTVCHARVCPDLKHPISVVNSMSVFLYKGYVSLLLYVTGTAATSTPTWQQHVNLVHSCGICFKKVFVFLMHLMVFTFLTKVPVGNSNVWKNSFILHLFFPFFPFFSFLPFSFPLFVSSLIPGCE